MPEMEHSGCECPILSPHARMQEAHDNIRILLAPTDIGRIKAINAIETPPPDGEVAGARALPTPSTEAPQRPERHMQQCRHAIAPATPAFSEPARKTPALRGEFFPQHVRCQRW